MRVAATLAMLGCALSVNAQTCEYPEEVAVPDGSVASKEEMLTGKAGVQTYMAAMQEYLDCIETETNAAGEEPTDEEKKILVSRHNAAVDEMETLAAAFNKQLRAYNSANSN